MLRWLPITLVPCLLRRARAAESEVRKELALLLKEHFVMPTPSSTVGEMKDMFAAMRFIATLRCGEAHWCAKAAPLQSLRTVSSQDIFQRLHASQNPSNCEEARYLIYHDDRSTSGFGWNAFILFSAFLQAFLEERVLVEAAAVTDRDHHRWHQRWCSDPPFSMKCFFRSWSRCERSDIISKVIDGGLERLPEWQNVETAGKTNSTCTCNEDTVLWRASRRSDDVFFPSIVTRGRFWWYAAMVQILMIPLPWLEESASMFLASHQLNGRPFVVAAVRRGNKSVEVPFVDIREFTNQLRAFKENYGIADVLLQTEDPYELQFLERWCSYQGLRLHYTENFRTGMDRFSTRFWSSRVNMTEEGRVAALNLLIGSRGVAVLGSFHSAWLKLQPAFMMAYHKKAVLVIGLASQDYQNFRSLLGSEAEAQQLLRPGEVFEPVTWLLHGDPWRRGPRK
mmetsp:Transcript_10738/g.23654  ORF Transcript_10738/g.23654 Transcript_10738/m.23654 type:complete len:452 (-) Transcript_10738:34-1389(-)